MKYLMLVCSEDGPIPDDARPDEAMDIEDWITLCGGSRIYGDALHGPETGRTVRVRDNRTLISDGPFTETKEFVAGFDLLDCEDLDVAIELAGAHPGSAVRQTELRPFVDDFSAEAAQAALTATEEGAGGRFLLLMCANGIPEADDVEAHLRAEMEAWLDRVRAACPSWLPRVPLGHKETATTVRRRGAETLLRDGPFVETEEFLVAVAVIRCADRDAATRLAAEHPLAARHRIEVREMFVPADWADDATEASG